jgi:endonuclease G
VEFFNQFYRWIKMHRNLLAFILFLFLQQQAIAACGKMYLDNIPPVITNAMLAKNTQEVCAFGYVAMHSGITRTPLWSAEKLTKGRIRKASSMFRKDAFHAEESLPVEQRAELADYAHSGYDRGHMAPSGDMPDATSQHESFSLANMVPQNPNNNRGLWEGIESAVRELAKKDTLYVVTGPLFKGRNLQALNGRVFVPTQLFKAVYDAKTKQAAAYLVDNAPGMAYKIISIKQLVAMFGIDVFPSLTEMVKANVSSLPAPTPHNYVN